MTKMTVLLANTLLVTAWVLLERERWALLPELQPMRCLLFVTLFMVLLAASAGVRAASAGRPFEAVAWFAAAYLPSPADRGEITVHGRATSAITRPSTGCPPNLKSATRRRANPWWRNAPRALA